VIALVCASIATLPATSARADATNWPQSIVWDGTNKCVDRDLVTGAVQIWDCTQNTNQVWTANPDGSITSGATCLETPSGETANNTPVDAAACTGGSNQHWSVGTGGALINAASGRCLDLTGGVSTDGTSLQVYDCVYNANQTWGPVPSSAASTGALAWDSTSKCVDRDVASGRVQIWSCLGNSNQTWTVNADRSITTGGVCLETPSGVTANQTLVDVAACGGGENQRWDLAADGELINEASGRCLDLPDGITTDQSLLNGTQLQIYDCMNDPNQNWSSPGAGSSSSSWTSAWGSAMEKAVVASPPISNGTCRNISRLTAGGTAVRIHLSNLYDPSPITFASVTVGARSSGASITSGTLHQVTFGGSSSVTIPANGSAVSDSISMTTSAGEDLAVSTYFAGSIGAFTDHDDVYVTHYCTDLGGTGGDHSSDLSGASFPGTAINAVWVSGIDVNEGSGTVVTLGDSITEGFESTTDGFSNYPDDLAVRLQNAGSSLAVVNEGIGGNAITAEQRPQFGEPAVVRFERDVIGQSNVKSVVVMEGTNDINDSGAGGTAASVENGLVQIAELAHAQGIRVIVGTIPPREGNWSEGPGLDDAAREAIRQQVNTFIRSSPMFDAVVDFDAALKNTNPSYHPGSDADYEDYMNPSYTPSNDLLHPNDAGYAVMANAIDLSTLG